MRIKCAILHQLVLRTFALWCAVAQSNTCGTQDRKGWRGTSTAKGEETAADAERMQAATMHGAMKSISELQIFQDPTMVLHYTSS